MRHSKQIIWFFCVLLLAADNAYAYLDPGSGSVILQAIVAALIGSALAIKVFWQRIKSMVMRLFSRSDGIEESDD